MDEVAAGLIGGALAGGVTSFFGPLGVDAWRERKSEKRKDGPRKDLLLKLLKEKKYTARSLALLTRVTGTSAEECRLLLIEIGARGVKLETGEEGWGLISRNPFTVQ